MLFLSCAIYKLFKNNFNWFKLPRPIFHMYVYIQGYKFWEVAPSQLLEYKVITLYLAPQFRYKNIYGLLFDRRARVHFSFFALTWKRFEKRMPKK